MKHYDVVIVGAGIAGGLSSFYCSLFPNKSILVIDKDLACRGSICATATVNVAGIEAGVSPLGDELLDGFLQLNSFCKRFTLKGVEVGNVYYQWNSEKNWQRRYGYLERGTIPYSSSDYAHHGVAKGYFFDPKSFLSSLKSESISRGVEYIEDIVLNLDERSIGVTVHCQSGAQYYGKKVLLTGGVLNQSLKAEFKKEKIISGSYWIANKDLVLPSFKLSTPAGDLIYRNWSKELLVGATTQTDGLLLNNEKSKKLLFENFSEFFEQFPVDSPWKREVGLRGKFSKRRPYLLKGEKVSCLGGLYKNGYNLSFKLAKEVADFYFSESF